MTLRGWLALVPLLALLSGCERLMHNMYDQPRYDPGEASPLFDDARAGRAPPQGTVPVAMGTVAMTSSGRRGEDAATDWHVAETATALPPVTRTMLLRGQERYGIYCLPCHSALGDGEGPIVQRGFPHPPSYHQQRLRDAPDRHFFDVMTHGYGIMYSYADRISPEDRWAIVAYIRALQLSQDVKLASLPPALKEKITAEVAR